MQDQQGVADITVKAWQMIREDVDPQAYLLGVLKDLEYLIPDGEEGIDLAEIAMLYVLIRGDKYQVRFTSKVLLLRGGLISK